LWKATRDGTATVEHRFPEKTFARALACFGGQARLAVMKNHSPGDRSNRDRELQRFNPDGTSAGTISQHPSV